MRIKPGVRIHGIRPEIVLAILVAHDLWLESGEDLIITSVIEGRHSSGSLHYVGAAFDLRTTGMGSDIRDKLALKLRENLGPDLRRMMGLEQ